MTKRFGLWALLLMTIPTTACETSVTVRGTVSVSAALMQMFSAEQPGRVVVDLRLTTLAQQHSIGILCGGGDPVRLPFALVTFGCATEGTVGAWLERVDLTTTPAEPCGPQDEGWGRLPPESPIREMKVPIFVGRRTGCDSGEQNGIELVLE